MADLSATSDDMTPEERLDYLQERGIEVDLKDKDRKAGGNVRRKHIQRNTEIVRKIWLAESQFA